MLYECPNTVLERNSAICEIFHGSVSGCTNNFDILLISLSLEGRWKSAINYTNQLGSKGRLAGSFAKLLHEMWGGDLPYVSPIDFRVSPILSLVTFL